MARPIKLFLCGDVMLGRGIDQIMPHPSDPVLYEGYMRSARGYLDLAERENGDIPESVDPAYVWGDALTELERQRPELCIINLETSVTQNDEPWPKGINYRMHPRNVGCLTAAHIDCCVLANNHVLDWEYAGLAQTLETLRAAHVATTGAGSDLASAEAPAVLPLGDGARVLVFAAATGDSGVPRSWAADATQAGVHRLPDLSERTTREIAANVRRHRRQGDRVIFSLHWGGNWGFPISRDERGFAHTLIDEAAVDIVYGHSSHHVKAIEVYREHLILYGCGDFLNDYEGIRGNEEFRGELGLMYFPVLDSSNGHLLELSMRPTHIRKFRVNSAGESDRLWLFDTLRREARPYGADVEGRTDGSFNLNWDRG